MDITSLLNTPKRSTSRSGTPHKASLSNMDTTPLQSSPADAHEVSAQLLADHDTMMEAEPTTVAPLEESHSTPAESPQPSEITEGTSEGENGRGNEDEDEDEDMASELSAGDDLQDDLEEALDDQNFTFNGTFYHAGLLTTAPNPCLEISGLGLIGLPLSERDAQAIISSAKLAPFGHGERTVVDKAVRDTWEVDPAKVSFTNPHWELYLKSTVVHEVCKTLGVPIGNHPPKLELHKLLLYEKGSHFLPHQDTQKANGMFATVVIVLPSPYTGGEVVVSHASTTKTIDFAPNSLLSTAILAWYTDVKHEVKEITKGYRLALSYNLIHQASSTSIPRANGPSMEDAVAPLRHILSKWKAGKYRDDTIRNLIAYLLDHEYSGVDLKAGFKALKGLDAQRVSIVRPLAEELGFKIGLANLEHNVKGDAEDYGDGYYRRGRYDEDVGSSGVPGMLEVTDTTTTITDLVDLDGKPLVPAGEIILGEEELIPRDPFDGKEPDDEDYEGYTGNEAGQLEYWYHRTVLVLMPENKLDDVCYSIKGIPYGLQKLQECDSIPATVAARQWANRLLKNDGHRLTRDHIVTLLNYALKWPDFAIWKDVLKLRTCSLQVINVSLFLKSWETFSFENVRVSFEEILARSTQLKERMDFIHTIRSNVSPENQGQVLPWCQKEFDKVLSSYTTATVEDIPTLIAVIRVAGFEPFKKTVMPNLLKKDDNFDFWIAFMKSLRQNREVLLEEANRNPIQKSAEVAPDSTKKDSEQVAALSSQRSDTLGLLVRQCLQAATSRWSAPPPAPAHPYYARPTQSKTFTVSRIIQIVEEALSIQDLDICRSLFADTIALPGDITTKFEEIFIPLITRLLPLLDKKKRDITSSPFVDFFQVLIGLYLKEILVDKAHKNPRLRKLGCGCEDCVKLDAFILDPKSSTTTFRLVQTRRSHLEHRLIGAQDLCSFDTIRTGSPHGLQITKHRKVIQVSTWEGRQKAAKDFLASIGPESVVSQIMGARYPEVKRAIMGIAPFGSGKNATASVLQSERTNASHTANSSASSSANQSHCPESSANPPLPKHDSSQLAGKKRKNMVQLGPVIDLTEDD